MGTNNRAKILGVWATLSLAHRLDIDQLQLLGDSKIVVDWLNHKCNIFVTSLMGWMENIRILITLFKNIIFEHIYREKNVEADTLSKKSLQVSEGRIHFNKWKDGQEGPPLSLRLYI
jgi:ribonuclease HI